MFGGSEHGLMSKFPILKFPILLEDGSNAGTTAPTLRPLTSVEGSMQFTKNLKPRFSV